MTPYQSLSYVSEMLVALLRNWRAAAIDHREPTISQEAIPTGRQEVSKANRWLVLQYHPTEQKPLESVQIIFTLLNTKLWICRIYTQPRLNHAATTLARHPPFLWKVLDLYCWRRPDIVKATCKFPVQLYILGSHLPKRKYVFSDHPSVQRVLNRNSREILSMSTVLESVVSRS